MQTVVLAGGVGRRGYPLSDKPKCLYEIMGRPLIDYVTDGLKQAGLRDLIFVVPEGDDRISECPDGRDGLNIQYAYQRKALGMGNALKTASGLLKEEFLAVNADDIYDSQLLEKILDEHKNNHTGLTLVVKETENPEKYGIIDPYDDGSPKRIVEKPKKGEEPSNLAVVGVYLFNPDIFDLLDQTPLSDHQLEDAYQRYMDRADAKVIKYDGYFGSFKYPWDILGINDYLMRKNIKGQDIDESAELKANVTIEGDVKIEGGVKIFENATIKGPCYIGKNTVIGNNTLVRESSIGNNCLIGAYTDITRSIIGNYSESHDAFIGDSILGERCWFANGVTTANLRLDRKDIRVYVDGQKVSTGRDKLGVITGNDVRVGIATNFTSPGTLIGSNVWIHAVLDIDAENANIPPNKIVKKKNGKAVIEDKI